MKKLLVGVMGLLLTIGLVGCDFAEGVDHEFGVDAELIFIEIDDDTMERELSDYDDLVDFDWLAWEAESEREIAFVNAVEEMLNLQEQVINGDDEALREYLKFRKTAIQAIGLGENGEWHSVPEFEFTWD